MDEEHASAIFFFDWSLFVPLYLNGNSCMGTVVSSYTTSYRCLWQSYCIWQKCACNETKQSAPDNLKVLSSTPLTVCLLFSSVVSHNMWFQKNIDIFLNCFSDLYKQNSRDVGFSILNWFPNYNFQSVLTAWLILTSKCKVMVYIK